MGAHREDEEIKRLETKAGDPQVPAPPSSTCRQSKHEDVHGMPEGGKSEAEDDASPPPTSTIAKRIVPEDVPVATASHSGKSSAPEDDAIPPPTSTSRKSEPEDLHA